MALSAAGGARAPDAVGGRWRSRVEVACKETRPGEVLGVIGACEALGSWQPSRAVRLSTCAEAFPTWSTSDFPHVPAGCEFKLVILESCGGARWEPIEGNRRWPADAADAADGVALRMEYGQAGVVVEDDDAPADGSTTAEEGSQAGMPAEEGGQPELIRRSSHSRLRERILVHRSHGHLRDRYDLQPGRLGEGSFGVVHKAWAKHGGTEPRAVKTVVKKDIADVQKFQREIELTRAMDHPSVIRLFDSYEDSRSVYLVMELCEGGDLFDRILEAKYFNEHQASIVTREMLASLRYLHEEMICHRDLKPENFLFVSKEPVDRSPLKLIDLGLARRFEEGEELKSAVGSAFYVAPEVLSQSYGPSCDLWSLGVILYILLSGRPPFDGRDDCQILAGVKRGVYSLEGRAWSGISELAKALVRGLLEVRPGERLTARQGLEHAWVQSCAAAHGVDGAGEAMLDSGMMQHLKAWRCESRFKRLAVAAVAGQLSDAQIHNLAQLFKQLDTNGDGHLTLQEMRDGIRRADLQIPSDLKEIMEELDTLDHSGTVSYTEFIAATLDSRACATEDACWHAFSFFDVNGDGMISVPEVKQVLASTWLDGIPGYVEVLEEFAQADVNNDGLISFTEFYDMILSGLGRQSSSQRKLEVMSTSRRGSGGVWRLGGG